MANPQKENGYTGIANEIMDKLCELKLSGSQWQIIMCVFRATYGWNKKEDYISLSQFEQKTGISRQEICKKIKLLVSRRLLLVNKCTLSNRYSFNKNWEQWVVNKCTTQSTNAQRGSQQTHNKVVNKRTHTKESKTIITKEIIHRQQSCPEANEILKFYKDKYGFKKTIPKQLENWRAAKWLYEQYGVERTCQAILAAKSALEDSVNGTDKVPIIKNLMDLKEKYDQLRAYYGRKRARSGIIAI